jgi:hypothetical protein
VTAADAIVVVVDDDASLEYPPSLEGLPSEPPRQSSLPFGSMPPKR